MTVDVFKSLWGRQSREAKKLHSKLIRELSSPKVLRTYEENGHTITVYETRAAINLQPNHVRGKKLNSLTMMDIV